MSISKKWDDRFLELAKHISEWSKDPSTKVGCVIVGEDREVRSTGFNGLPRGIDDSDDRLNNREIKYPLTCHAEENAIMHAARVGLSLEGCVAYSTWPPCTRCARSLIQAGVSSGANFVVKKSTGKTITEHAIDVVNKDIYKQTYLPDDESLLMDELN